MKIFRFILYRKGIESEPEGGGQKMISKEQKEEIARRLDSMAPEELQRQFDEEYRQQLASPRVVGRLKAIEKSRTLRGEDYERRVGSDSNQRGHNEISAQRMERKMAKENTQKKQKKGVLGFGPAPAMTEAERRKFEEALQKRFSSNKFREGMKRLERSSDVPTDERQRKIGCADVLSHERGRGQRVRRDLTRHVCLSR